jgi:phosphopantetheinyl transferase (holo-ACP synthase)
MSNVTIFDVSTGELYERPMTETEIAQAEQDALDAENKAAELAAKEAARQALLDKLGLTADEAKLLLNG